MVSRLVNHFLRLHEQCIHLCFGRVRETIFDKFGVVGVFASKEFGKIFAQSNKVPPDNRGLVLVGVAKEVVVVVRSVTGIEILRSCVSICKAQLGNRDEHTSMNANGPKSRDRPMMLVLSVFNTPFIKP